MGCSDKKGCCASQEQAQAEKSSCCSSREEAHGGQEAATETITRHMTIGGIFRKFPHKAEKLADILTRAGLHCVGCSASTWETLEAGVLGHGMDEAMLEELIHDLNATLQEYIDPTTITVTPKAAARFIAISLAEGKAGWGLRFDEKPAGCSGYEHTLEFSEKASSDDEVFSSNGIEIHILKKVVDRLRGSEIDFVDGLQSGFKITNPNVRASCGCGNSHGY